MTALTIFWGIGTLGLGTVATAALVVIADEMRKSNADPLAEELRNFDVR